MRVSQVPRTVLGKVVQCASGPVYLTLPTNRKKMVHESFIPTEMQYVVCAEKSFRRKRVRADGTQLVICCPKGEYAGGRCRVGTISVGILHPKSRQAALVRACESGALARRRESQIRGLLRRLD